MGEYAKRKSDGLEVKIGTCNEMHYLRYEHRKEVRYDFGNEEFYFRIPTPKEDDIKPGDYDYPLIGQYVPLELRIDNSKLDPEDVELMSETEGVLQMHDERMGLLVNLKCPHGLSLSKEHKARCHYDSGPVSGMFYNGYSNPLYLSRLKNTERGLLIMVECRCCKKSWLFEYHEIEPAIMSVWMRLRLLHQCAEYYYERNLTNGECKPFNGSVLVPLFDNTNLVIEPDEHGKWLVSNKDHVCYGEWSEMRNKFISMIPDSAEWYKAIDEHKILSSINLSNFISEISEMKNRYIK